MRAPIRGTRPEAGLVVEAAHQIFAILRHNPGHGSALLIPRRFGFTQRLESLLAVDHFAALIIVKFLKLHGFNSSSRSGSEVLKLTLSN
jgi:hypothetical protein